MTKARGVAAAGHEITAQAAADILSEGGNAFDAALAAMFTACVPETVLASVGGGGFLMAHDARSGVITLYDFFARTPARTRPRAEAGFRAIHADFGPARQEFHIGAGATAVPGFVQGAFAVHRSLCTLPMTRILEPAISAARGGVTMTAFHAYLFTVIAPILMASQAARELYAPGGELLKAGETFRNPQFADMLEVLALDGERLFTEGDVGRAILRQSREEGGHLTPIDLERYRTHPRDPISWRHGGTEVALNPPPAAGGALIGLGLALSERLHDKAQAPSPLDLARIMEQTNRARDGHLDEMLAADVIARHLEQLRGHASSSRGTTHISVIDAQGNAAAVTISNGEGNGLLVGGHGFMLNNMLGEEDLHPGGFFNWSPGTRLSSMMAPTLLRDGEGAITALGSGGSNRIRSALLQVISHLTDRRLPLAEAIGRARLHVERDGVLSYEAGAFAQDWGQDGLDRLLEAFPQAKAWPEANMFFGGVHAARRSGDGRFEGAADARRHGAVVFA